MEVQRTQVNLKGIWEWKIEIKQTEILRWQAISFIINILHNKGIYPTYLDLKNTYLGYTKQ